MKSVACANCDKQTEKTTARYNESLKNGWNFFCSIKCRYAFSEKAESYLCARCSQTIQKTPAEIRKTKKNVFCSKSCAARFNNRHKKSGTRRSKLEFFLESQLAFHFPNLYFLSNSRKEIGLELDFYFPELKLAIEINGFLHFKPIYGSKKLESIQKNDHEKISKCKQLNIHLRVINVSNEFHLTQSIKEKHWETVRNLVVSGIKENRHPTQK